MESRRARRILLAAFVFSLLVHAVVAFVVRRPLQPPPVESQVVTLQRRAQIVTVQRSLPSPPPTPKPAMAQPKPATTALPSKAVPASPHGVRQPPIVAASAAPVPSPTAHPTPQAVACAAAAVPAMLVGSPPPAEIPPAVRAQATSGTARVRVSLDRHGVITGTTVTQSTGNPSLDLIAESMANGAHYAPAYANCKAIASTYEFGVKFAAW